MENDEVLLFIGKVRNGDNIIIVDEFIGSGTTISKAISWFEKKLEERKVECTIYVCVIAAMESAISKLNESGAFYFSAHWLRRGITDHYAGEELKLAINQMQVLESLLATDYDELSLKKYRFGYKKSEALYARDGGNACNNVFPIFWWPALATGEPRRTTVLDRL